MKFIPVDYIRDRWFKRRQRKFAEPTVIKVFSYGHNEIGVMNCPKTVYVPRRFVGRRVRLMIQILEDDEVI